jgi:hypothetical protein
VSGVFGAVGVAVADEGCFPVIVNVGVGDGDIVGGVGELEQLLANTGWWKGGNYINETIIVVFVVVKVRRHIDMIDPNIRRLLYT